MNPSGGSLSDKLSSFPVVQRALKNLSENYENTSGDTKVNIVFFGMTVVTKMFDFAEDADNYVNGLIFNGIHLEKKAISYHSLIFSFEH